MDIMSLLINTVGGAGGGYLGNMVKKNALGMLGNVLAGAVGGNALPAILSAAGILGGGAADATAAAGGGGFDIMSLVSAVLGGGLGSVIGGLFKKA